MTFVVVVVVVVNVAAVRILNILFVTSA